MEKNSRHGFGNIQPDINAIREAGVTLEFRQNIGKRALILIAPFPFLIIGRIEDVVTDYLIICTEITNVNELDGEEFRVHIDDIEVFYIEKDKRRPIPDIRNGTHA
ncbi:hypothetical protein [Lysinibacillus sp. SGAir0095]|uniref:hypothetical protein n=1 Tax=Lysinibacillus sp. SGAir0095 TaxID=2070463 RepID=UPI0010CD1FE8|nr:hypothetical protein [Lysinibacillus sp. SGAir0095]QCR32291.1 hypothetical protein C1N55_08940 [Lysinibacillus sp. SGAir0095]